jgi:hypothetical protein
MLIGAAMAMQLAAFWPGIMTWDAIRQYGQAVSGRYDDWHPPAMNALWHGLRQVTTGPAPMLVVQAVLYWGGTLLLAIGTLRRGHRWSAAAILALAALPIALVLLATILKDSLFAGTLLLAAGLLAVAGPAARWPRVAAGVLLVAAATLRFNAVPACLPLLVALAPPTWRQTWSRLVITTTLAAVPLVAALPLANAALRAERSGVELSLVIYDLGGIGRFSDTAVFPPTAVADPVAVNRACYSPVSWDRYAWWGAEPCPIGFETLHAPLTTAHGPYRWWLAAVAAHPLAYLEHRLAHFDRNTRFLVRDADLPGLSLDSDPNRWGYAVAPNPVRGAIAALATGSLAIPLGWPACWIALTFGLVVVRPSLRGADALGSALAWSALLYALSYLPLSVASEVRYHFWTMTATGVAAALLLGDRAQWIRIAAMPRWRRVLAVAPFAAILLGSIAARVV